MTRAGAPRPANPITAWIEERGLAGDHVLRTYEDGAWALWHPDDCGAMGVDCDFDRAAADARPREDMPATVVVAIDPATQLLVPDLKAHWEDVVSAALDAF